MARAMLVGNMTDGFRLVTKEDGTLWDDDDSTFEEAGAAMLAWNKDYRKNGFQVVPVVSSPVSEFLEPVISDEELASLAPVYED